MEFLSNFKPKPKPMVPLLCRFSPEDLDELIKIAEKQGTKKAILVRTAVKEFINRRKIPSKSV